MDGVSVALGTMPEHAWSYVFFKLFTESFCSEAHPLSILLLFASLGTPLADSVWGREAGRRAHPYSRMSQLNLRWWWGGSFGCSSTGSESTGLPREPESYTRGGVRGLGVEGALAPDLLREGAQASCTQDLTTRIAQPSEVSPSLNSPFPPPFCSLLGTQ